MAISDALNSFAGLQSTFGPIWTVQGRQYTNQELIEFVAKNQKKLTKEAAKNTLEKWKEDERQRALLEKEDFPVLMREAEEELLYVGNGLYIALCMEEYGLVKEFLQKKLRLAEGKCLKIHKNQGFDGQFVVEEERSIIFDALLGEKGRKMPKDVWVALWEQHLKQMENTSGGDMSELKWPLAAEVWECQNWLCNIYMLKEKYPELYKKVVTEEFFDRFLLACSNLVSCSKKDWSQLVKKIQALEVPLASQELLWDLVKEERTKIERGWFVCKNALIKNFLHLWKKVSNQPVQLDLSYDEYWKDTILHQNELSDFKEVLYGAVDRVINAEKVGKKAIFQQTIAEGQEMELITALKIDLITKKMVGSAVKYAQEENQSWAYPLLILKAHGEWNTGEAYEK